MSHGDELIHGRPNREHKTVHEGEGLQRPHNRCFIDLKLVCVTWEC